MAAIGQRRGTAYERPRFSGARPPEERPGDRRPVAGLSPAPEHGPDPTGEPPEGAVRTAAGAGEMSGVVDGTRLTVPAEPAGAGETPDDEETRSANAARETDGGEEERTAVATRTVSDNAARDGSGGEPRPDDEPVPGTATRWAEDMPEEPREHPSEATGRTDGPDERHRRPEGLDDLTVEALGKLSEALETVERVRGHLYSAHQLTGTADFALDEAVSLFMQAGHTEMAERIQRELIGRNVIPGHWTFQIVEEFDDGYYAEFREVERDARERYADGRRHLYEAELKERRRTRGRPGHEARPDYSG